MLSICLDMLQLLGYVKRSIKHGDIYIHQVCDMYVSSRGYAATATRHESMRYVIISMLQFA